MEVGKEKIRCVTSNDLTEKNICVIMSVLKGVVIMKNFWIITEENHGFFGRGRDSLGRCSLACEMGLVGIG